MRKKFQKWTTVLAALLCVSCSSELAFEGGEFDSVEEEVDVTFSVSTESLTATRASGLSSRAGGIGSHQGHVGRAENIDMLIYAVYDENYTLMEQYSKGIDSEFSNSKAITMIDESNKQYTHNGQSIISVKNSDGSNKLLEDEGLTLTFRLMRNKTYHIVFWAQSSKTDAYNTDDLTKVKVNYRYEDDDATATPNTTVVNNNDELRDAFCKVETFSVSTSGTVRKVILTRPFAQINLGTTGADYKYLLMGERVDPNKKITQSKILLKGVADTYDAVRDEIGKAIDKTVVFDYSVIPAFMYQNEIPTTKVKLLGSNSSTDEEFLKVDYNGDGSISNYKTSFPTLDSKGNPLTETFKYLSMCYVLVPATKNAETNWGNDVDHNEDYDPETPVDSEDSEDTDVTLPDTYKSTVLDLVQIHLAESDANKNPINGYMPINLTNVPAQRNYRTNIIGGMSYSSEPKYPDTDPDDPDNPEKDPDEPKPDPNDPTPPNSFDDEPDPSVFGYTKTRIIIDESYWNDTNVDHDDAIISSGTEDAQGGK